jgi:predicted  nucleic acid-binding Zn-ribbon protein
MSDAIWLDKCRADLLRARTACENQKHIILDLENQVAQLQAELAALRDAIKTHKDGFSEEDYTEEDSMLWSVLTKSTKLEME